MDAWLNRNRQHKYGVHRYTLKEFGLTGPEVRERMAEYVRSSTSTRADAAATWCAGESPHRRGLRKGGEPGGANEPGTGAAEASPLPFPRPAARGDDAAWPGPSRRLPVSLPAGVRRGRSGAGASAGHCVARAVGLVPGLWLHRPVPALLGATSPTRRTGFTSFTCRSPWHCRRFWRTLPFPRESSSASFWGPPPQSRSSRTTTSCAPHSSASNSTDGAFRGSRRGWPRKAEPGCPPGRNTNPATQAQASGRCVYCGLEAAAKPSRSRSRSVSSAASRPRPASGRSPSFARLAVPPSNQRSVADAPWASIR